MPTSARVSRRACLCGFAATLAQPAAFANAQTRPSSPRELRFDNVRFLHRWSKDGQHEFTPEGEENLARWNSMFTINRHATVKTGDQLADIANRTAENYKRHGRIIRTASRQAGPNFDVEYLAVAMFVTPEFIEVAFTRFLLANGAGFALTYSKRIHDRAPDPRCRSGSSPTAQDRSPAAGLGRRQGAGGVRRHATPPATQVSSAT